MATVFLTVAWKMLLLLRFALLRDSDKLGHILSHCKNIQLTAILKATLCSFKGV